MEPDDNRRLQDDEKVVIESTYGSDAKFELNAWKIWKPLSVCVHLKPLESASRIGQNATVFVDLSIVCSAEYPQVSPILSFKEHRGVSTEAMKIMMAELNEKAKTLLGSPMILELCEDVRTFLYDQKPLPTGSFHDTMLKKKAQDESEIKRQRANSEKRELEQVVEERERHNLEAQWRKEAEGERPEAVFESTDTEKVRLVGNRRCNFIEDARHRPRISPYCTEWIGSIKDERFLVSEWSFKYTLGRQKATGQITNFDEIVKKLFDIEQQIMRFKSMFGHDHTVIPCNYADVQRNSRSPSNFNVVIQLTQKLDDGDVCLSSILDKLHIEPNLVRRLAAHTVCALRWLHDQQASHGAISVNSIWTNDNSFRLSDASTLGALLSLAELFRQATAGVATSVGVQDEKSSRKKDLFALGTLLDTIARNNSPSNSCSAGSNEQLVDFIKACQSAKAIEELLDHPYLILDLPASGSSDNALGNRGDLNNRGRLVQEFFLMKWLGKGGFGDVILAKNKLDGNDYAIKRITLNPKSEKLNRRITREAKMFSRLNHPNVVRYYSAWIEDGSKQKDRTNTPASKKNESEVKLGQLSPDPAKGAGDSMLPTRLRNLDMAGGKCGSAHAETSEWSTSYRRGGGNTADSSSSDDESDAPARTLFSPKDSNDEYEIVFKSDSKETNSSPVSSGVTTSEIEDPTTDVTQSSQGTPTAPDPTKPTTTTVTTTQDTNDITIPSRMLFIQMEYCERSTLRAYIDNKSLFGHTRPIWRMFREILSGLSYIHSKAMIHRDIKPMNILLDSNEHVKIGDFGLATPDLIKKESVIVTMDPKFSGQTRDIGTELYMAPELFKVDDVVPYTSKIDIYSTGVVLFEMFYRPLPPGMERISTIRTLKTTTATVRPDDLGIGYFPMPDDFGTEYSPVQAKLARKLVVWMLQEDANSRPTVEELLAYDELPIVDIEDQTFQSDFLITVKKRSGQLYNWMLDTMFKQEPSAAHNYCFDQDICKTDLRQNFIRYCCRNSVNRMKRYTFDRVFSCKDGMGRVHPNERWESCVDSIGPVSSSLTLTSELLITVGEMISAALSKWKCTIRIGHVGLIESIMRHLTIHEESWPNVMQCLHEISTSEKPISHAERVEMLGAFIGERKSTSLFSFLTCESSVALTKENCRMLYRSRDESVRDTSREALNHLDRISEVLNTAFEESSSRIQIVYDLSLAYRPTTFKDGLVFLMSTEVPMKKYTKHVTLLGGGRYDSLLERERHAHDEPPPTPLCLIGCSISLERMANLRKSDPSGEYISCHCSAVVCSFSSELVLEKFRLCQSLWRLDIATDIFHEPVTSLDNLIAHCETNGIEHILVVFSRDEVLLRSNRIDHGKMDFGTALATVAWDYDDEATSFITTPTSSAVRTTSVTPSATASHSNCVIDFAIPDRVPFNTKKRIENQVKAVLHDFLSLFASKGKICVVITELSVDLLKTIAGSLTRTISVDELNRYFYGLARNHGKSKRDIDYLLEVLQQIRSPRNVTAPVIILFRHLDGFYRTVT